MNEGNKERSIIIDDDANILFLLENFTKKLGYFPKCYERVSEFKKNISSELEEGISLLISDKDVNGEDGYELTKWLRDNNYNFPIILISGDPYFEESRVINYKISFLRKPFDLGALRKKIEQAYSLVDKKLHRALSLMK